jgi:hypothetical protein
MKKKSVFTGMTLSEMVERVGFEMAGIEYVFIYNGDTYEYSNGMIYSPWKETWHDEDIFDEEIIEDVYKARGMYYIEFKDGKPLAQAEFLDYTNI